MRTPDIFSRIALLCLRLKVHDEAFERRDYLQANQKHVTSLTAATKRYFLERGEDFGPLLTRLLCSGSFYNKTGWSGGSYRETPPYSGL